MTTHPHPYFLFSIGSTKLSLLEVRAFDQAFFEVTAFKETVPSGFDQGNVTRPELAVQDIRRLIQGVKGKKSLPEMPVYVLVGSALTNTYSLSTSIYFPRIRRLCSQDVERVRRQTQAAATLPLTERLISCVAQDFIVNDLNAIENPIGLEGTRLGVNLLMETMDREAWKKLTSVFEYHDIRIKQIFSKQLAGVFGLLTPEERQASTLLVDVGGTLTALAYVRANRIRRSSWLSFGGENWTSRVLQGTGLPLEAARSVKERFGSVAVENHFSEERVPGPGHVPGAGTAALTANGLTHHLLQGMEDFRELLSPEIQRIESVEAPIDSLVVAGGGAQLDGFLEYIERSFNKPTRLGRGVRVRTQYEKLLHPQYASSLGAMRFLYGERERAKTQGQGDWVLTRLAKSTRQFFEEYF